MDVKIDLLLKEF